MELELHPGSKVGLGEESPALEETVPYQQNENLNSISRGSSSRFKGVMLLKSGKWGARISYRYKPYWLGTHQREEDAAMAYDRAAMKLQRGEGPLNFSWTNYSVRERIFQNQYSNEEILDMIKDQTYPSKYVHFISSHHSPIQGNQASKLRNERRISYQLLFQKELTRSDVTNKAFLIPKKHALLHFPSLDINGLGRNKEKSKSIKLIFYDKQFHSLTFQYSFWKSSQSFVFTKGWGRFLRMNNLNQKDIVFFYRGECEEAAFYMIDAQRNSTENSVDGRNIEQEMGSEGNINDRPEVDFRRQEETNKVVNLFGVQIG